MAKIVEILLLMMLLCACTRQRERIEIAGDEDFREGDMVLRCGWGVESQAVVQAGHSLYSHIGMLHYDVDREMWMVIHAVPGEAINGEPEYVKCEPLSVFYAPERARRGAWLRVACSDSIAKAAATYAMQKVAAQTIFDNDYLLSDTIQLYCTELVWQAYLHQGIDISDRRRHDVPLLFSKDGACIFPNDIEDSSKTLFVQPFKTRRQ